MVSVGFPWCVIDGSPFLASLYRLGFLFEVAGRRS